jgi:hypothetical protein
MISKKTLAKITLVFIVGSSLMLPIVVAASTGGTYSTPSLWPTGFWGPLVSCTGNYIPNATNSDGSPVNACQNLCDLIGTFINIIIFGMSIAIFIVMPISFLVGAIMIMVSGANPGLLQSGKKVLWGVVIGLAIVLCSYLIVNTFVTVLGITGIGGFGTSACTLAS